MKRDEIISLIRSKYDPQPDDWPRHRGWDDGAGDIADAILADDPYRYFNGSSFKEDERPNVGLGWMRQQFPEAFTPNESDNQPASVLQMPAPADIWQFTVEVVRRPDGQHAAKLVHCRTSLIEVGVGGPSEKLTEIANLLQQAIGPMRADAAALGVSPS
jgi:hypothetical protein